nr:STAS domain-containing protein [Geomonas sp. Red32]
MSDWQFCIKEGGNPVERKSVVCTHLQGDWSSSGIGRQLLPLSELSTRLGKETREVHLDCSGIEKIDRCGIEALYSCLHRLQTRGYQPRLIAIPQVVRDFRHFQELLDV